MALHLDGEVSRFLGGVRTPAVTGEYLADNLRHWVDHGFGLWTLRAKDGAFIGRAGLRFLDVEGVQELEIAYTLVRSAWGRGLATEVAEALVGVWKALCPAASPDAGLVGIVMKGNCASERVLLKVGFVYERDAAFHDELCSVFRLLR